MRRFLSILGSAVFLVIAPGAVAGYLPWRICRWQVGPPLLGIYLFRLLGDAFDFNRASGLARLLRSFRNSGSGDASSGLPNQALSRQRTVPVRAKSHVCCGPRPDYRTGATLRKRQCLAYGLAVWVAFSLFVLGYEEPTLRNTFGAEYEEFCANVPRWLPRLKPWQGSSPTSQAGGA